MALANASALIALRRPSWHGMNLNMFRLTLQDHVATLLIDRAASGNSVPLDGWGALAKAIDDAERDGARALVLLAQPGAIFCAGADVSEFDEMHRHAGRAAAFRETMRHGLDRLRDTPIATIAYVDGACRGAGVALALSCDMRMAGPSASFAITPARFGISYPQADIAQLVACVGPGQAARLLLSAASVDAAEALRIGLADLPGDALAEAYLLARIIAANAPESVTTLKRGIALVSQGVDDDGGQDAAFDRLAAGDLLAERLAAFRERAR